MEKSTGLARVHTERADNHGEHRRLGTARLVQRGCALGHTRHRAAPFQAQPARM